MRAAGVLGAGVCDNRRKKLTVIREVLGDTDQVVRYDARLGVKGGPGDCGVSLDCCVNAGPLRLRTMVAVDRLVPDSIPKSPESESAVLGVVAIARVFCTLLT